MQPLPLAGTLGIWGVGGGGGANYKGRGLEAPHSLILEKIKLKYHALYPFSFITVLTCTAFRLCPSMHCKC